MMFRAPYAYDRDQASRDAAHVFVMPSLTQPEFASQCDINEILKRFGQGHPMPDVHFPPMTDVSSAPTDFFELQNFILRAREEFMLLPSALRERFGHQPSQLYDFLADPANAEEAVKLGLAISPDQSILDVTDPADTTKSAPPPTPTPNLKENNDET